MAIQLTAEQEQRIQAVVNTGAYPSAEDALDAALAVVEAVATPGFEGSEAELEGLLLDGLASMQVPEDEFWGAVERETNALLAAHKSATRT